MSPTLFNCKIYPLLLAPGIEASLLEAIVVKRIGNTWSKVMERRGVNKHYFLILNGLCSPFVFLHPFWSNLDTEHFSPKMLTWAGIHMKLTKKKPPINPRLSPNSQWYIAGLFQLPKSLHEALQVAPTKIYA